MKKYDDSSNIAEGWAEEAAVLSSSSWESTRKFLMTIKKFRFADGRN